MNPLAVIMAGGSGERFWPLSRRQRPKQLLRLTDPDRTLLAEAVDRIVPLVPRERVFVATGEHLRPAIAQSGVVPPGNIWCEPCKRNTAGCLIWAAAQCRRRFGAEAAELDLAILTADHRIGAPERFRQTVRTALETVAAQPLIATIGIAPEHPETGYGYIEAPGAPPPDPAGPPPVVPVASFREKPNQETAESFLESGHFYWNSGMFFWRLSTFQAELAQAQPELSGVAERCAQALLAGDEASAAEIFAELPDTSIDYALMERTRKVAMVRGDFPWDDVGSWSSLDRFFPHDPQGNVAVGDPVLLDAHDCVVYNEPGAERMAVGVIGVHGLAVIVTADGVLVVPKEHAQEVRKVVKALKEQRRPQV